MPASSGVRVQGFGWELVIVLRDKQAERLLFNLASKTGLLTETQKGIQLRHREWEAHNEHM